MVVRDDGESVPPTVVVRSDVAATDVPDMEEAMERGTVREFATKKV